MISSVCCRTSIPIFQLITAGIWSSNRCLWPLDNVTRWILGGICSIVDNKGKVGRI